MQQNQTKPKSALPLCPMCRNQFDSYYRIPRVIPKCGHTFCQKCINSNIIAKSNRKLFICPNCQSQTIIRKGTAEDIPTNIQILDISKSIKKKQYEDFSPINSHKYHSNMNINANINNFVQSCIQIQHKQHSEPIIYCQQHQSKPMDLICQTCNYQHVCSTCVLLSKNHQQHKFVQFIPASTTDLSQLYEIFTIIQDSVKQTILPSANYNIIKKSQQKIISSTISTIQKYFKDNYYKIIQKKQQQLIRQCKQIKLQLPLYNKIQQITKIYDLLKDQYEQIKLFNQNKNKKVSLNLIEGFIKKCKELHHQIQNFSEYSQKQCEKILKDIVNKIEQTQFVKINQVNNTLKNVLTLQSHHNTNNINNSTLSIPNKHQKYTNSLIKSPQRIKADTRSVHQMRTTYNNSNNNFANININKKSSNNNNNNYQQNYLNDFDLHNQFDQIRSIGNTKSHIIENNKNKQKQVNFNVKSNKASSNSNICMPPKCNNNKNNNNSIIIIIIILILVNNQNRFQHYSQIYHNLNQQKQQEQQHQILIEQIQTKSKQYNKTQKNNRNKNKRTIKQLQQTKNHHIKQNLQ